MKTTSIYRLTQIDHCLFKRDWQLGDTKKTTNDLIDTKFQITSCQKNTLTQKSPKMRSPRLQHIHWSGPFWFHGNSSKQQYGQNTISFCPLTKLKLTVIHSFGQKQGS